MKIPGVLELSARNGNKEQMYTFLINHSTTTGLILGLREVRQVTQLKKRKSQDSKPGLESLCTLMPACPGHMNSLPKELKQ